MIDNLGIMDNQWSLSENLSYPIQDIIVSFNNKLGGGEERERTEMFEVISRKKAMNLYSMSLG